MNKKILITALTFGLLWGDYTLSRLDSPEGSLGAVSGVTLRVQGDKIAGNSGCNGFFGRIVNGNQITDLGSTMMACPPEDMAIESRVLSILKNAPITMQGGQITIQNARGVLTFRGQ